MPPLDQELFAVVKNWFLRVTLMVKRYLRPLLALAFMFFTTGQVGANSEAWSELIGSDDGIENAITSVTVDDQGDLYAVGYAMGGWSEGGVAPKSGHEGAEEDVHVLKLDGDTGDVIWHTFLGGSGEDQGEDLVIANGSLYVTGRTRSESWGSTGDPEPVSPYGFSGEMDVFLAKLNLDTGAMESLQFIGGGGSDRADGIAYASGKLFLTGYSSQSDWRDPGDLLAAHPHTGDQSRDIFVLRIDEASGNIDWYAFFGDDGLDSGGDILVSDGYVYVSGSSSDAWEAGGNPPVRGFTAANTGAYDAFILKMDTAGILQWYSFLGGEDDEQTSLFGSITLDGDRVYVAGFSLGPDWGETTGVPLRAYTNLDPDYVGEYELQESRDAFVTAIDKASGALDWYTFLGGDRQDEASGIWVDGYGNLLVGGYSRSTWGAPRAGEEFGSNLEHFLAYIDSEGELLGNGFYGRYFVDGGTTRDYYDYLRGMAPHPDGSAMFLVGMSGFEGFGFDGVVNRITFEDDWRVYGQGVSIENGDTTPSVSDGTDFGYASSANIKRTFTLRNNGAQPLVLQQVNGSYVKIGWYTGLFSVSQDLAAGTIAPGGSLSLEVTFTPSSGNSEYLSYFELKSSASAVYRVWIRARDSDKPDISILGPDLDNVDPVSDWVEISYNDVTPSSSDGTHFGQVAYSPSGANSVVREFQITNNGLSNLQSSASPYVTLSSDTYFGVTASSSFDLTTGSTENFTVTYTPTVPGTWETTVSVYSNDTLKSPFQFKLRGVATGPDIAVTGNNVDITDGQTLVSKVDDTDFGTVAFGDSLERTYRITNLGEALLTISAIDVTGSGFSLSGAAPTSVAPGGGSETFKVKLTPSSATSTHTGSVTISNNDPDEADFSFNVYGKGGTPVMGVSNGSSVVGNGGEVYLNLAEGDASTSTVFTITNNAVGANLILEGDPELIQLSNTSQFAVTVAPDPSGVIEGKNQSGDTAKSDTFEVTYTPTDPAANYSTTVTIPNNDVDDDPFQFTIYGGVGAVSLGKTGAIVSEHGAKDWIAVTLGSKSSSDVVVAFSSADNGEVRLANAEGGSYAQSASVTIPAGSTSGTLWIQGVDDAAGGILELDQFVSVTGQVSSSDPAFNGYLLERITVRNRNRDFSFGCTGTVFSEIVGDNENIVICKNTSQIDITGTTVRANASAGFYAPTVLGGAGTRLENGSKVQIYTDPTVLDRSVP